MLVNYVFMVVNLIGAVIKIGLVIQHTEPTKTWSCPHVPPGLGLSFSEYTVDCMAKNTWTSERDSGTSHSKTTGIHMLLLQPRLFWEDFPEDI